uniref:Venom metalloproteinase 1 n=1 Tax=Eulophus pennicornis TaxID=108749 RepID=VMP01_EULPE|nr:RecName: Full=Venom metalloproteinase 1; Short=EpMP1; Flags: Precursor [Eulophus pennicornis]ACF60597.1 metalloproteinase 1 [Eulophus pennicornis]
MDLFILTRFILFLSFFMKSIHCQYSESQESGHNRNAPDKELTTEEFQLIFHQSQTVDIEYDFINITTEMIETERKVSFTIDGKEYHLSLTPAASQSVLPYGTKIKSAIWWTDNDTHIHEEDYSDERWDSRAIYENLEIMATILVRTENGTSYYDGVFVKYSNEGVRSLPGRLMNIYGANYHFVYDSNGSVYDVVLNGQDEPAVPADMASKIIFYSETPCTCRLLIIQDLLMKTSRRLSSISTIFWNAVNLRFRPVQHPKVNIIITGIVIAKNEAAFQHVYRARYSKNSKLVHTGRVIDNGRYFFGTNFDPYYDNYDASFTMASMDDPTGKGGATVIGGICSSSNNIAYIRDVGSYSGVKVATHELGHLLNGQHDSDTTCSEKINDNIYTIMAKQGSTKASKFVWSSCTLTAFANFSKTTSAACLKDTYRKQ